MDQPLPVSPGEADSTWLDQTVMDSDDNYSSSADLVRPSLWIRTDSNSSSRSTLVSDISTASQMSTGPLSPISTGTDIPGAASDSDACLMTAFSSLSSAPTLDTSTSSSSPTLGDSTSPSSNIGSQGAYVSANADSDDAIHSPSDNVEEMQWEASGGEDLAIPKIEPGDEDDFCLEDVQEAPFSLDANDTQSLSNSKMKRPRGRPRKLSMVSTTPSAIGKVTKGRSKTGCITCRKRKKKCDEAKPRCLNCEKNAVVCEGYPEKQIWKSGKEKAEEELLKSQSLPIITMQPIFIGLETGEDRVFWKHYNDHLSAVFTVEGEHKNAFRDMLVPLATRHQGMMHSILSLASRHLDYDTPYGAKLLRRSTKITTDSLQHRGSFHNSEAVKKLYKGMQNDHGDELDSNDILAARYGQMLCLVLESLAEGHSHASQRLHYEAFLYLIQHSPPHDQSFYAFIAEIFYYHIFADDLLYYPSPQSKRLVTEDWTPVMPIHPPRLIGVADGLFNILSQITYIRNRIREKIQCGADPRVDYDSLYRASDIEGQIYDWMPEWPAGDSRERVTLLYKQMAWLYLKTTICPPPSMKSSSSMSRPYGSQSRDPSSVPSFHSNMASCASSPSPELEAVIPQSNNFNNPRRHSIANPNMTSGSRPFLHKPDSYPNQAQTTNEGRSSPPPIRRPSNHEPGVSVAVEESMALLEGFKPSDPAQTLLLIPCVIVGTACYSPAEQERVRNAIGIVHGYTGLRNTGKALEILNEVWRLMDCGDYLGAWDWQGVAHSLKIEHLF